jgi:hypothetical protein
MIHKPNWPTANQQPKIDFSHSLIDHWAWSFGHQKLIRCSSDVDQIFDYQILLSKFTSMVSDSRISDQHLINFWWPKDQAHSFLMRYLQLWWYEPFHALS